MRKNRLHIGHLSTCYHSNFILMQEDDLKAQLGVEVDWHIFGTGPEMVAAFKNNELEGGVGTPCLSVFAATLLESRLIIRAENLWDNNPSYGIFFYEDLIENNPDFVLEFLALHKKSATLLRNSPDMAAKLIADTIEMTTEEYVKEVLKISPKYCIALSEGYVQSTMEFVGALHRLGYIKRTLRVDEIFEFRFVEKVHPEHHHYV